MDKVDRSAAPAWLAFPVDTNAYRALKALSAGEASPEQQKLALDWVIYIAAMTYGDDYRTDSRDHAYAAGRRSVGLAIVTALTTDLAKVQKAKLIEEN